MNQYCRYCSNAYLQGDDLIWCGPKDEIRAGREITRINKCPYFDFNPIDVLDQDRVYRPREKRQPIPAEDSITDNQISLFQEETP